MTQQPTESRGDVKQVCFPLLDAHLAALEQQASKHGLPLPIFLQWLVEQRLNAVQDASHAHQWQKIRATEYEGVKGVQWLEVCLHCHSDRRILQRHDGRSEVLRTNPEPLQDECGSPGWRIP